MRRWILPGAAVLLLTTGAAFAGFMLGRRTTAHAAAPMDAVVSNPQEATSTVDALVAPPSRTTRAALVQLESQPPSPGRDAELAAAIERLAVTDPASALSRALAETHRWRRAGFVSAALRGWAAGAPEEAAQWALARPSGERESALAAVLAGAAKGDPQAAVALGRRDPAMGSLAFRSTVIGWAQTEAVSLADFAVRLPAGNNRTYALGEALRQWVDQDPVGLAGWLDRFEPNRDLDEAVSQVALQPFLAERRPGVAVSWAESITDRHLRSETLGRIVQAWATTDRAGALVFVEGSTAFDPVQRADLLNLLGGTP